MRRPATRLFVPRRTTAPHQNSGVSVATKHMNVLDLIRKQTQRKEAVKQAQKALVYRGNTYLKQTAS